MEFDKQKPGKFEDLEIRWVPGYKEEYAVSEDGRIFSFKRNQHFYELNLSQHRDGHFKLNLYDEGKETKYVHRLVLLAFEGPPPTDNHECRHLDGDPKNNHIDNLTWGTPKENMQDKKRHDTQPLGEDLNNKISKKDVVKIRTEYKNSNISQRDLASKYNISQKQISKILRGQQWQQVKGPTFFSTKFSTKLSKNKVVEIRKRYKQEEISQRNLASQYNVSRSAINNIVNGESWVDAGGPIKDKDY